MLDFIFTKTPLVYFVQNFWRDEAFSYLLAKKNLVDIFSLTARDFNPPLYYVFLHFWMKLSGSSEIAIRSLSLIFYIGTVYFVYLFLINILKIPKQRTLLYLALFILNPFLNYFAFEARMYMALTFFTVASFYFLLQKKFKAYLIATTFGLYTHYFMALTVVSHVVYAFLQSSDKKERLLLLKKTLVSALLFLPWIIFVFMNHALWQERFWILKTQIENFYFLPAILYTGYEIDFAFYKNILPAFSFFLYGLAFWALYKTRRKKEGSRVPHLLAIWAFLPAACALLISFYRPIFLPRYLIASSVGLFLLVTVSLEHFPLRLRTFLLLLLVFFSITYMNLHVQNRQKVPIKKVLREIKGLAKPSDLLYVTSELDFHTAQYYFDENRVFIYGKPYEEVPSYVGKVLIPKNKIKTLLPLFPQKAFVLKEDLTYDIQALF